MGVEGLGKGHAPSPRKAEGAQGRARQAQEARLAAYLQKGRINRILRVYVSLRLPGLWKLTVGMCQLHQAAGLSTGLLGPCFLPCFRNSQPFPGL